ncbi:MAG TPA: c-type cytochrome biogenesis protein CcmI [Pyrinomonadaceae bacterium]|nr:c-type cytochrome biogenesis protein CcmI [Pyrinomonadaceae bacterium]
MLSFWIFAGLLIAVALCYVLPPLLQRAEAADDEREQANVSIYRDQLEELERDMRDGVLDKEQYEQGRLELQRRLLEDVAPAQQEPATAKSSARGERTTAVAFGIAIPILAVVLYYQIGTPKTLAPGQPALSSARKDAGAGGPMSQPGAPSKEEIEKRVASLAARLKENPDDAQGWAMLARSYQNFKRYKEASDAYARAAQLTGNDAQLWTEHAETLALASGSQFQGQPLASINKALQIDPNNEKALWLAGNAAFQARNFKQAAAYWERLEKLLPAGSEGAQTVSAAVAEARAQISGAGDIVGDSPK